MPIDPSRWFWCPLCQCPTIKCLVCNNTDCNGGGCDSCKEDWAETAEMFKNGTIPDKKDIPQSHHQWKLRQFAKDMKNSTNLTDVVKEFLEYQQEYDDLCQRDSIV